MQTTSFLGLIFTLYLYQVWHGPRALASKVWYDNILTINTIKHNCRCGIVPLRFLHCDYHICLCLMGLQLRQHISAYIYLGYLWPSLPFLQFFKNKVHPHTITFIQQLLNCNAGKCSALNKQNKTERRKIDLLDLAEVDKHVLTISKGRWWYLHSNYRNWPADWLNGINASP